MTLLARLYKLVNPDCLTPDRCEESEWIGIGAVMPQDLVSLYSPGNFRTRIIGVSTDLAPHGADHG